MRVCRFAASINLLEVQWEQLNREDVVVVVVVVAVVVRAREVRGNSQAADTTVRAGGEGIVVGRPCKLALLGPANKHTDRRRSLAHSPTRRQAGRQILRGSALSLHTNSQSLRGGTARFSQQQRQQQQEKRGLSGEASRDDAAGRRLVERAGIRVARSRRRQRRPLKARRSGAICDAPRAALFAS